MGLEMRKSCERCNKALKDHLIAYICVHECTYCKDCTSEVRNICLNCNGELVRRPKPPIHQHV